MEQEFLRALQSFYYDRVSSYASWQLEGSYFLFYGLWITQWSVLHFGIIGNTQCGWSPFVFAAGSGSFGIDADGLRSNRAFFSPRWALRLFIYHFHEVDQYMIWFWLAFVWSSHIVCFTVNHGYTQPHVSKIVNCNLQLQLAQQEQVMKCYFGDLFFHWKYVWICILLGNAQPSIAWIIFLSIQNN